MQAAALGMAREHILEPGGRGIAFIRLCAVDPVEDWFVNLLHQPSDGRGDNSLEQLYLNGVMLSTIRLGWFSVVGIVVGHEPGPDADREGNRQKLSSLPGPFTASVYDGNSKDGDGLLTWGVVAYGKCIDKKDIYEVPMEPGGAVLEIGSTTAVRSFCHLRQFGALARWPYGSKTIYLVHWTDKNIERQMAW